MSSRVVFSKRTAWRAWLMASAVSLLAYSIALAAPGDLDTSFSGDGKQTTNFGAIEKALGVVIQPDGKIAVSGFKCDGSSCDMAIARYNANGTLDTSFSGDGRQVTDFGGLEEGFDLAIQANGKIVVVGSTCASACDLAVARYNANGTLDSTFSGDGKQVIGFGTGVSNGGEAIVIQPDGKIVIAGDRGAYPIGDFAVYRLNSNGTLDSNFSGDGRATINFGDHEHAYDLALQANGTIVVIGAKGSGTTANFALARLNPNGTLDASFSGDGRQVTDFGSEESARSVAIQSNGKIVVAGNKCVSGQCDLAVARYNTNGSLDSTFSGDGKQVVGHGTSLNNGTWGGLVIQPDGKIVIAGYRNNGSNDDFALYRLNSNGALDTSFSGDGRVVFGYGLDHDDIALDLALGGNGKYVLAGYTYFGGAADFAVARVLP